MFLFTFIAIVLLHIFKLNSASAIDYYKYDRQPKQHNHESTGSSSSNGFTLTCPKPEYIHPCDCLELDKRLDGDLLNAGSAIIGPGDGEGSGDGYGAGVSAPIINSSDQSSTLITSSLSSSSSSSSSVPTIEVSQPEMIHPDLIETVAFCKNIRNVQVLTDAIKGFQGHRVNYFVLDGCKLPPFPNNLFQGVGIQWMEILNSTIQFHEPFFNCAKDCF